MFASLVAGGHRFSSNLFPTRAAGPGVAGLAEGSHTWPSGSATAHDRDDETAASSALIASLYPVVRKHLGFLLGFHPATDDAVQESMLAIYRALPRFRRESSPTTWALAIASRIGRRHLRRERRLCESPPELAPSPDGFEPLPSSAELALLVRAFERLAPKKREAFILMAIFELTAREAAAVLGTFANTAASRYRHARAELQDTAQGR